MIVLPLYRPEVSWLIAGGRGVAVPPLDVARLDAMRATATAVADHTADRLGDRPDGALTGDDLDLMLTGGYAAGVADLIAWLTGNRPSPELSDLLEGVNR